MPAAQTVRARCLISRLVGDDSYAAGETYEMDGERARKYALSGYFEILADAPEPEPEPDGGEKQADPPPNKMRGRAENKGWRNARDQTVELDGTVIEEAPDDAG